MQKWATALVILLIPTTLLGQDKIPDVIRKALEKLDKDAADPAANLTVGKYFAEKGDWDRAIPHFARSNDAVITPVIEKDLAGAKEGKAMVELGDAWLEVSAKRTPKKIYQDRALHWFQQAWQVLDGKEKESLRRIFYKVAPPPPGYEKLVNPSWTAPGWFQVSCPMVIDPAFGRSGASAKFVPPPVTKGNVTGITSPRTAVVPGRRLKLSFWAYTDKTTLDGSCLFRAYTAEGDAPLGVTIPILMDSPFWKKYEREFTIPDNCIRFDVLIQLGVSTGGMWVDDVSVMDGDKELLKNGGFEEKK